VFETPIAPQALPAFIEDDDSLATARKFALLCKQKIEDFWAQKGYSVCVDVALVPFCASMRSARYDVRSDLVDGLPKDWRP
jgi:hypothetical protein